jgi:hypothetical protein
VCVCGGGGTGEYSPKVNPFTRMIFLPTWNRSLLETGESTVADVKVSFSDVHVQPQERVVHFAMFVDPQVRVINPLFSTEVKPVCD